MSLLHNITESQKSLFMRDLSQLKKELSLFEKEDNIWKVSAGISNSSGNLALHLIGNLNHFIGNVLGNTGYIRKREEEFSTKHLPLDALQTEIDATIAVINATLDKVTEAQFQAPYPIEVFGKPMTTFFFLSHLSTHLSYHLGQINYLRRLLEG